MVVHDIGNSGSVFPGQNTNLMFANEPIHLIVSHSNSHNQTPFDLEQQFAQVHDPSKPLRS